MKKIPILFTLLLVLASCREPITHPPGVLVQNPPEQVNRTGPTQSLVHNGYVLTILADYDITGRVIRTRRYNSGTESEISPIDVGIGWGIMSDTAILNQMHFRQYSRFLFYRWEHSPPAPFEVINRSSANMHMIPADRSIERQLKRLRPGHIVQLQGYLVQANKDRFRWRSSLTREDMGNGACEIMYVEYLEVLDPYLFYSFE